MCAPVWSKKWHNDVFTSYSRSQYCIKKAKIMSHNRITIVLPGANVWSERGRRVDTGCYLPHYEY